jgi:hypothetical protein
MPSAMATIAQTNLSPTPQVHSSKEKTIGITDTGCSITPCSALSQASCRSPNDRRGTALLPEDVGGPVGVTIYKKASAKAAIADKSGQTLRGSGDRHAVFAVAGFAMLFGGVIESCFLSKKVAKWYKRLKDC